MLLFSGNSHPTLALELSTALQIPLCAVRIDKFADGETRIAIKAKNLRNCIAIVMQSIHAPVNDNLIELLLLVNAVHNAGAQKIIAVVPYLGYLRQDYLHTRGVACSSHVIAKMLNNSNIDHLITLDLHNDQIVKKFAFTSENITNAAIFAHDLNAKSFSKPVFVAPDVGALKRTAHFAEIFNADIAIVIKKRLEQHAICARNLINEVKNRECVIIDDIIDSGNTLYNAAMLLKQQAAKRIYAYITHPVLSNNSQPSQLNSVCQEIIVSNSIPLRPNNLGNLRQVSSAYMLAHAVRKFIN